MIEPQSLHEGARTLGVRKARFVKMSDSANHRIVVEDVVRRRTRRPIDEPNGRSIIPHLNDDDAERVEANFLGIRATCNALDLFNRPQSVLRLIMRVYTRAAWRHAPWIVLGANEFVANVDDRETSCYRELRRAMNAVMT